MGPVDRVTIHHRGGGSPSDVSSDYSEGGYTYGIGLTRWEHFRPVWVSYATLNFNHVSVDVCLSGNRMTSPVTDSDITLIRGALADARARGYVIDHPIVVAHKNSPGSATVCPGDFTMNRWPEIVLACQAGAPPIPAPKPIPKGDDVIDIPSNTQDTPNRFRGASIDLSAKTVASRRKAAINPNPNTDPGPAKVWRSARKIADDHDGVARFVIVTDDDNEYGFRVE